ncbi:MAG: ATP-grasp domain-containing protein [Promethearchaeota archaeon]
MDRHRTDGGPDYYAPFDFSTISTLYCFNIIPLKERAYQDYYFCLVMVSESAPLRNKQVGVIGFNARPIAASATRAGANVYVSDYWGDDDLSSSCKSWIAVLTPTPGARQRQPLEKPLPFSLVENLLHLTERTELDFVIVGSGFDDIPEALEPLETKGLISGCSPAKYRKARNPGTLNRLAQKLDINYPKRRVVDRLDDMFNIGNFPCVIRPTHSGGGHGIRFARNQDDVINTFGHLEDEEFDQRAIQEYISGFDISCSVLSSKNQSFALSVQGQLIGMPSAGRNCDFAYCGNFLPSLLKKEVQQKIASVSEEICTDLELSGSIGIDFIVDRNDEIWLMEVNPRIQGSMELLERSGSINVSELHVAATGGLLPRERPKFTPGVKMIVYSRRDGKVSNLAGYPSTVDRTPSGVVVNMGDPICTIIETSSSLKECYAKAVDITNSVQKEIG